MAVFENYNILWELNMSRNLEKSHDNVDHVAGEVAGHAAAHVTAHVVGHVVGASNAVSAAAGGFFSVHNCMPEDEFSHENIRQTEEYLRRTYGENSDGSAKRPWQQPT